MRGEAGFTLLEILSAAALLAIILTILYSTASVQIRTIEQTRNQGDIDHMARVVMERMADDISSAYFSKEVGKEDRVEYLFAGTNGEREGIPEDSLRFTSLCNARYPKIFDTGDIGEIEYYVKEDLKTGEKILLCRHRPLLGDEFDTEGEIYELATNLKGLDFHYIDKEGETTEEWDTEHRPELPSMVRITLLFEDTETEPVSYSSAVFIPLSISR